jgi:hypothetical protein
VPFSLVGAVWLLYALGYNVSIAVWVGMIALMGPDPETGVFMLLFLDLAYEERVRNGQMRTEEDLTEAIIHGAVRRVRPKLMTVSAAFMGLLPVMWATGTGADLQRRSNEAHRSADGRRPLHVVRTRAPRLSADLRDLEIALDPLAQGLSALERRYAELADAEDLERAGLELIGRRDRPRHLRVRPHLVAHEAVDGVADALAVLVDWRAEEERLFDVDRGRAELGLDRNAVHRRAAPLHPVALVVVDRRH